MEGRRRKSLRAEDKKKEEEKLKIKTAGSPFLAVCLSVVVCLFVAVCWSACCCLVVGMFVVLCLILAVHHENVAVAIAARPRDDLILSAVCMYIHRSTLVYIYIYIYIERERDARTKCCTRNITKL